MVQLLNAINVQLLNNMKNKEDHFEILRKIQNKQDFSQRDLANELGFSLGKLNYCLKSLKEKGLIKIKNFKKNPKKMNYIYVLTPKGIIANRNIKYLSKIEKDDICFARPATEFNSYEAKKIIGKRIYKNIKAGDQIKKSFFINK